MNTSHAMKESDRGELIQHKRRNIKRRGGRWFRGKPDPVLNMLKPALKFKKLDPFFLTP